MPGIGVIILPDPGPGFVLFLLNYPGRQSSNHLALFKTLVKLQNQDQMILRGESNEIIDMDFLADLDS